MQTKVANGVRHEVVLWRREQLTQSGFPLAVAARLAEDARYDLHALIELVERGCRPEVAVRIVAPLDGEVFWAQPPLQFSSAPQPLMLMVPDESSQGA